MISGFNSVRMRSLGLVVGAIVFVTIGMAVGLFYASSSTVVTVVEYPYHQISICERTVDAHGFNRRDNDGVRTAAANSRLNSSE